jgi:hypothetical protein
MATRITGLTDGALAHDEADIRTELAAAGTDEPRQAILRIALLRNLYQQGRLEEVTGSLAPVLASDGAGTPAPAYAEMLALGALALAGSGHAAEALPLLDRQPAGPRPNMPDGMIEEARGRILFLLGRDSEAAAVYRAVSERYRSAPAGILGRLEVTSRLAEIYSDTDFWALTATATEFTSLEFEFRRDQAEHPGEYVRMMTYVYELPAHVRVMEAVGRWTVMGQQQRPPVPCGSGEIDNGRFRIRAIDPDTMARLNVTMAYNHYLNDDVEQSRRCALWAINVIDRSRGIPASRKAPALMLLAVLENHAAMEEKMFSAVTIDHVMRLSRMARSLGAGNEGGGFYLALLNAFDSFFASALQDHARAYLLARDSLRYISSREAASIGRPPAPWWVRQSEDVFNAVLRYAWAGAHAGAATPR